MKITGNIFLLILILLTAGCSERGREIDKKVIILGMDGLDPELIEKFIEDEKLPNFAKLREAGSFRKLRTSHPPQSPVAWSNFITGNNPGKHGIFDFIQRNPENYEPHLSTSTTIKPQGTITAGRYRFSIIPEKVINNRGGRAFWEYLVRRDIPSFIIKIPSSFPPEGKGANVLSGLGTPDVKGTNGEFSFYTDSIKNPVIVSGGTIYPLKPLDGEITTYIYGPENPFVENDQLRIKFSMELSRNRKNGLLKVQGEEILINEGEWSEWIPLQFRYFGGLFRISAIARFYLKSTSPFLKLYLSPLNINPLRPAVPVSSPVDFSKTLYRKNGYYYTQGLPEESKALRKGLINRDDYLKQNLLVWKERKNMFESVLKMFESGVLFFYFTTPDVNQHLFWSAMDSTHPGYTEELKNNYGNIICKTYRRMDSIIGKTMEYAEKEDLLIVISDHGFAPFSRSFNINSWLNKNGYLTLHESDNSIDWEKTEAYSFGFNSIYLNLKGREGKGTVKKERKETITNEIIRKLENMIDSKTGRKPIHKAYRKEEIYSGEYMDIAPDIIVGYNRGYRTSWDSPLTTVTDSILSYNYDPWSGTHLIAPEKVPGIIFSNRKITLPDPDLRDVPATVLNEFGIDESMEGRNLFKEEEENNVQ